MFEVRLLKNTSGLGFSFSREENIPDEPPGSSMVRVKKLFPGQPAAESGRISVGDVILRVNQTHLRGLSQHVRQRPPVTAWCQRRRWKPSFLILCLLQEVISALRGTGQEVNLRLCRPDSGVLPEIDTSVLVSSSSSSSTLNCVLCWFFFFFLLMSTLMTQGSDYVHCQFSWLEENFADS